ncbi:MAG: trypsin-like serine protease [Burkholderiales bacterium]|nr:trypsin-like serine protease [Burkholderiales bacterium]
MNFDPLIAGSRRPTRRRVLIGAATTGLGLLLPRDASAIMAGNPPDSAAARVDPNTPLSPWSGVVSVVVGGAPFSGVVIGPRHVLTAAHVALNQNPANVTVVANTGATPTLLAVEAVTSYPTADFPYNDLSMLRLVQAVPASVAVYPVMDAAQPLGTRITLVGYGGSGNPATGASVAGTSNVKRVGQNVIDQLADRLDTSGRTGAFYLYDFDGPIGNGPIGAATLGNSIETSVAGGDSGSAAFVDTGSGPALYGLNTAVINFSGAAAGAFGSGGTGMVLSHPPYVAWLAAQTNGSMSLSSQVGSADVPALAPWGLAALGGGLAWWMRRPRTLAENR